MNTKLVTSRSSPFSRGVSFGNQAVDEAAITRKHRAMKASAFKSLLVLVALLTAGLRLASAQSFSIDWFTVDGGGGTSTGGVFTVSGTIGQPDAGGPMTGGNFSLTGGFWALYALQSPGAPVLSIKLTTTNTAMVYWLSPSTGYNLQVNTNLATANWVTPAESVTDNGTLKYIIVNPPSGRRFYRLKSP